MVVRARASSLLRGGRKLSLICRKLCALGMRVVRHCQDPVNPKICGFQRAFGISRCCLPLVSSNGIDSRMDCALREHSEKRCGETAGPCDPAAVGEGMSGRNELWRRRITAGGLCKPPAPSVTSCGIHVHARCQTEKQQSGPEVEIFKGRNPYELMSLQREQHRSSGQ